MSEICREIKDLFEKKEELKKKLKKKEEEKEEKEKEIQSIENKIKEIKESISRQIKELDILDNNKRIRIKRKSRQETP